MGDKPYQLDPQHIARLKEGIPHIRALMQVVEDDAPEEIDAGMLTAVYLMGMLAAEKIINRELERLELENEI